MTYLYEDPEHPGRQTGAIESPAFTEEDRCLLLALDLLEGMTCSGCGEPIEVAWHSDMDGWYETESFVCFGCTARSAAAGGEREVAYLRLVNQADVETLTPFRFGETTREPMTT